MKDFNEGQRERIRERVIQALQEEREGPSPFKDLYSITNDKENYLHVVDIGTSVLCAKWEIGYKPGGFVQALVDNDLFGAFRRGDSVNVNCIGFYVKLMESIGYID